MERGDPKRMYGCDANPWRSTRYDPTQVLISSSHIPHLPQQVPLSCHTAPRHFQHNMHRQDKVDKVEALLFVEACCATVDDGLAVGLLLGIPV